MEMLVVLEKSIEKIVIERIDLESRLEAKDKTAGFFYSENDFQISLIHEFEFQDNYKTDFIVHYEKSYGREYRTDIVLEEDSKLYPIELKYVHGIYGTYGWQNKDFFKISDGFEKDILKMRDVFCQEKNMKQGYCIALVEEKHIENIFKILGVTIKGNKLPDTEPIKIYEDKEHPYNYRFVYKQVKKNEEKTPFHYFIVEISRKDK
ncbi:MAG: hypothetical protein VB017_04950 [Endomicrobiaceae bacterium]|nr:hypothetical protein [Endomicrobiaceae bacterium]